MNEREIRAYSILAKGDRPQVLDTENYLVKSQSGNGKYRVSRCGSEWSCECPDHASRKVVCKHIHSVMFWLKIRGKRKDSFSIPELEKRFCPFCKSPEIIKRGIRKNRGEPKQRYSCRGCGRRFVADVCIKFKGTDKTVTLVMDLYFKGVSLRKIRDHLIQFHGIRLSHVTIYYWIARCMKAMGGYVNKLSPKLSDTWHADEQFVKARNKEHEYGVGFVWNVMDSKTRFLITSRVTEHRARDGARETMIIAKEKAGKEPKAIITDKLIAYREAVKQNLPNTEHYRYKGFMDSTENNRIERFHGSFRERDKVMRGLKSVETADRYAKAFRTYYNFLRPHMGLNGLTPADMVGLNLGLNGGNRWLSLLKRIEEGV